jgi:hypothetical protein
MMRPFAILGSGAAIPATDATWENRVPAAMKRRDPRIWKMAYAASAQALAGAHGKPRSLCVATALGALDETKSFLDGVFSDGFGSPRNFIASVHNSMAGKLAMEFSIDGPNLTLCDGPNSFASAIAAAALLTTESLPCLVVAVDESIPLLRALAPYVPKECALGSESMACEGAVALLLDNHQPGNAASVRAVASTPVGARTPEDCAGDCVQQFGKAGAQVEFAGAQSWFLVPALRVHAALSDGVPGTRIVASYSFSSKACAAIEVTI